MALTISDLNPIELIWEEMNRQIRIRKPTNEAMLLEVVHDVWNSLTPDTINNIIDRMPALCQAVIAAEGGYFDEKYAPRKFQKQLVYNWIVHKYAYNSVFF